MAGEGRLQFLLEPVRQSTARVQSPIIPWLKQPLARPVMAALLRPPLGRRRIACIAQAVGGDSRLQGLHI